MKNLVKVTVMSLVLATMLFSCNDDEEFMVVKKEKTTKNEKKEQPKTLPQDQPVPLPNELPTDGNLELKDMGIMRDLPILQ